MTSLDRRPPSVNKKRKSDVAVSQHKKAKRTSPAVGRGRGRGGGRGGRVASQPSHQKQVEQEYTLFSQRTTPASETLHCQSRATSARASAPPMSAQTTHPTVRKSTDSVANEIMDDLEFEESIDTADSPEEVDTTIIAAPVPENTTTQEELFPVLDSETARARRSPPDQNYAEDSEDLLTVAALCRSETPRMHSQFSKTYWHLQTLTLAASPFAPMAQISTAPSDTTSTKDDPLVCKSFHLLIVHKTLS